MTECKIKTQFNKDAGAKTYAKISHRMSNGSDDGKSFRFTISQRTITRHGEMMRIAVLSGVSAWLKNDDSINVGDVMELSYDGNGKYSLKKFDNEA